MFFLSFQSNQKSFIQRCKICHFLVAILFTMMPCIILLEISCEDELPIFKRSLLNFSTRYDASSIVKQKGTVFQWHLPKWSMIESRNICMYFSSFEFPALIFTLHHFLKIRIIYVSTLILLYDLLYDILFKMSYKPSSLQS